MELGPVTYLVVEFIGNQFKGEIVPEMQELVDKGLIRLMDFVVVRKNHDGSVDAVEVSEHDEDTRKVFAGMSLASHGLLGLGDIEVLAEALESDTTAGIVVFENVWAKAFADSIVRANGRWVLLESVPADVLDAALADMP